MARTGFVWDRTFLGHRTSSVHREKPERVADLDPVTMAQEVPGTTPLKVDSALGLPWIARVHDRDYVRRLREAHGSGVRFLDGGDTFVAGDTFEVATFASAAAVTLTEAVFKGRVDNGFVALRPPGHHAGPSSARGFCYFDHAAECARYAQQIHGARRVLVVDWDVHPGDGTEAIFYEDPDVHVMSLHQKGLFAETCCAADQTGRGEGEGATYNSPLEARTGPLEYLREFERVLDLAAARCRPDLIIISCGFDAHAGDPLGGLCLVEETFRRMTSMVLALARQYCSGRVVSLLEGGYSPPVVRRCARAHIEALLAG